MSPAALVELVARLRESGASTRWTRAVALAAAQRGVNGEFPAFAGRLHDGGWIDTGWLSGPGLSECHEASTELYVPRVPCAAVE